MPFRAFETSGRSAVYAENGMAATSHPAATLAAIDVLRAGGTAADAAVTAALLLSVIEPHMNGIGGDAFFLVAREGQPVAGYNGSGRAARGASAAALRAQGRQAIDPDGAEAVTVPGAVDAYAALLEGFGRFGLDRAAVPAVRAAREGFPLPPRIAWDFGRFAGKLAADPATGPRYLPWGRAPVAGDRLALPGLAEALEAIAQGGRDGFYRGAVAADIAASLQRRGSPLDEDDLARHRGEAVTPLSLPYAGLDIVELPPNGQGITALVLLGLLQRLPGRGAGSGPMDPARVHMALEAARLAYGARDRHVAEPAAMTVPVEALLSDAFLDRAAALIDPDRQVMGLTPPVPQGNTTYLTVVDRDLTAVSLISSLYREFGTTIATDRFGILLQNRGACFTLAEGHPNEFGPGKRPMHTIIPALALENGRCVWSFGVMGGGYQAMGHAWVTQHMLDHGLDPQQALEVPRLFFEGAATQAEAGVPAATREGLEARGHRLEPTAKPMGGGQIITIDRARGVLVGASEPRKDGMALGY